MKIAHIALWTENLENMKDFYVQYFRGNAGAKYFNSKKQFESYFVTFDGGVSLEIMRIPDVIKRSWSWEKHVSGFAHIAFSTGSREQVDALTEQLREQGYRVVSEPRTTGDGYYESCILDPDGNMVEITE